MKTPKPIKLPSGNYFVRLRLNGVSFPITASTAKECTNRAEAIKSQYALNKGVQNAQQFTLVKAIDSYINSRGVISPSTVRGYMQIRKRLEPYHNKKMTAINWSDVIKWLDTEYSPKTIKNTWGFLRGVMRHVDMKPPSVNLPVVPDSDLPFLEPEQIYIFLDALKGDPIEVPALLALHSLRRSEICNLKKSDFNFKDHCFKTNGAAVYDENNKLIHKNAGKNKSSSKRTIPIMIPRLEELTRCLDNGYIYSEYPNTITRRINRICRDNDLPEVGCHGLRRSFASLAYHLGWSEAYTMEIGGWSDPQTMRKIYIKLAAKDRLKQSNLMTEFYKNVNEMSMESRNTA